jgi:transcription elongation factor Elf1
MAKSGVHAMARVFLLACPKCDLASTEQMIESEKQKIREITCKGCGAKHTVEAMMAHGQTIQQKRDKPKS